MASYVTRKKWVCSRFRTGTPSLQLISCLCFLKTVKGFWNESCPWLKNTELKEAKAVSKTQSRGTGGWTLPIPAASLALHMLSGSKKSCREIAGCLWRRCKPLWQQKMSHCQISWGAQLHWEFVHLELTSPCTSGNIASCATVFLIFKASKAMAKF